MFSGIRIPVLFVISLLGVSISAQSQSVKEIVSHYKQALQRATDTTAYETLELSGSFTMQKMTFPVRMFHKFPTLSRIEMTFQNLQFLQISNDSLKWEYNPMEDQHVITYLENKDSGWSGDNNSFDYVYPDLLNYETLKHAVKLVKKLKIDSLEVFVLELTKYKQKGKPAKLYINTKTHLLYKIEDEKGYRYFARYGNDNGFVFPRFLIDASDKQIMEVEFDDLKLNRPLSDSLFIIPQKAFDTQNATQDQLNELLSAADIFYNNGKYDSATWYYTRALKVDNVNFRAFNSRGLSKIGQQDYYDAIADFNRAIELDPASSKAFNNRGLAKFYLNDRQGAIDDYTKALDRQPDFGIALKNRGHAYVLQKNYEQSISDFSAALHLKPDDGETHFKLGVAKAQLGQYDEALKAYHLAFTHQYHTAEFFNYKGVTEYHLQNYSDAKTSFLEAVKGDAGNLQYLENYGRALFELSDYEAASNQFDIYLKKHNDNAEIHNLKGLCKYHTENYKGAIKDFTKAIEVNGKMATYYDNRAAAKEMIEDYDGAIKDYGESIRVYPNDASVFYKRGLLKLHTSKKIEGCLDLTTAHEMQYEPAKEAILKNCH